MTPIPLRACLVALLLAGGPARACGDGETPVSCDEGGNAPEMNARWMLKRVVAAVEHDRAAALAQFIGGTGGFRTADTYVFCVGPDGMMTAHPNAILRGQNVRDLHDRTGNHFIRTMMETARPGTVSVIRYLFPKPGGIVEAPKTTFYTRAGDQTCAVGVYEADANEPAAATPETRITQLQQRLDHEIPEGARADWHAFLEALAVRDEARRAVLEGVRANLRSADAALAPAKALGRTGD